MIFVIFLRVRFFYIEKPTVILHYIGFCFYYHSCSDTPSQAGLFGYKERISYYMSIGEKKRVSLVSILSMNLEILLIDEPFAGFDPCAEEEN